MIPPVHLQDLLVIPSKRPGRLGLPEDPRTSPDKVVVEEPLVEGALPALPVQDLQGFSGGCDRVSYRKLFTNKKFVPASLHALKS